MKLALTLVAVGIVGMLASTTKANTLTDLENFENLSVSDMCAFLPADTHFLRPNTCANWVKCGNDGDGFEEGVCAQGLYYDKDVGKCKNAESVLCPYGVTGKVGNRCANLENGVFIADPERCNGYILCDNELEKRGYCPNGLVFNPATSACVYESNYKCPIVTNEPTSKFCRAFQAGTSIADDQDCTKYYICDQNGTLATHYCDVNMAYDQAYGKCLAIDEVKCFSTAVLPEPENTFCLNATSGAPLVGYFRDEESCSKYYVCGQPKNGKHDTEPKHLDCTGGQYFDAEKVSCRDRLNVKCNLDRCAGVNLNYVNVANDCTKYARCKHGVTESLGQCPEGHYFDERKQVCTPQVTKYVACSA